MSRTNIDFILGRLVELAKKDLLTVELGRNKHRFACG